MNYEISGKVIAGRKLGRKLGFATANIAIPEDADMVDGVYAGTVTVDGKSYGAMMNVGHRPSVGDNGERMLEAHLFDFAGDLYGKTIAVRLLKFVRVEEKFDSLEELKTKIAVDRKEILDFLESIK